MPTLNFITNEIFTISDFFSEEECLSAIELAESHGFSNAPITTMFGPVMRSDVRNNTRVMYDDEEFAEQLWQKAATFLPAKSANWSAIGLNERLRYYRYDIGQQFDWHYDGAFERGNGERSQLTLLIYLNDDFEGGQTSFDDTVIVPQTGLALCFVHQLRHKGQPVLHGRKYVLRTDVMYQYQK